MIFRIRKNSLTFPFSRPYINLSPDGSLFVVSGENQAFELYRTDTSVHLETFADKEAEPIGHNGWISPAIFVHNGRWLLGGGAGKAILWHVKTKMQIQTLRTGKSRWFTRRELMLTAPWIRGAISRDSSGRTSPLYARDTSIDIGYEGKP